jgi:formate hydrogenlyase subunit 4
MKTVKDVLLILLSVPVSALLGALIECVEKFAGALMAGVRPRYFFRPFADAFYALRRRGTELGRAGLLGATAYAGFNAAACAALFLRDDLLPAILAILIGSLSMISAAWSLRSPFARDGARNEALKFFLYAPVLASFALAVRLATGSFTVEAVFAFGTPLIYNLPLIFVAVAAMIPVKAGTSPFDFSKDAAIEFNGPAAGMAAIGRWFERAFLYGVVAMFVATSAAWAVAVSLIALLVWTAADRFLGDLRPKTFLVWGSLAAALLVGINFLWIALGGAGK